MITYICDVCEEEVGKEQYQRIDLSFKDPFVNEGSTEWPKEYNCIEPVEMHVCYGCSERALNALKHYGSSSIRVLVQSYWKSESVPT